MENSRTCGGIGSLHEVTCSACCAAVHWRWHGIDATLVASGGPATGGSEPGVVSAGELDPVSSRALEAGAAIVAGGRRGGAWSGRRLEDIEIRLTVGAYFGEERSRFTGAYHQLDLVGRCANCG